jgi:hypothetical protein
VVDSGGAAVAGATVATDPATTTATTDASGNFSFADIAIGSYAVTASKTDYSDYTLNGVGVAADKTTTIELALGDVPATTADVSGTVTNAVGDPVSGATVTAKGTAITATSDASGNYTLTGVDAGFLYVQAAATGYLEGETHNGVYAAAGATTAGIDITLSSAPSASATYVGTSACVTCHAAKVTALQGSAHAHSITADKSRMLHQSDASVPLWPAVGGTVDSGVTAISPVDGTGDVSVYLCQPTAGDYAMKFGGTANCAAPDGTLVPVSGTYGGEGHGGIDSWNDNGQIDPDELNYNVYKQRFLARLADVPNADGWTYDAGKDKDFLILPVQITQSGSGGPTWGGYHGGDWATRGRTFSKKCAGCHNTGLAIEFETGTNYITSYDYQDLNIGCETCHGPASEHIAEPTATKKLKIITAQNLTPSAQVDVCAMCHSADAGSSTDPSGGFGYPWNHANLADVGAGNYVPGVYKPEEYIKGYGVSTVDGGGNHTWPDGVHGEAHRQQVPQFKLSMHANNPYEQLTCATCHDVHSLFQGPAGFETESGADTLAIETPKVRNNTLCLSCHATHGPFEDLTKEEVAALHIDDGGVAKKNGTAMTFTAQETVAARTQIAAVIGEHMQDQAGMGLAFYDPTNDDMPVGRCSSCHMPRTAKSGGWTTGLDGNGDSALAAGDQGSHIFQVVWPWQSAALKTSASSDTDIMPNSCGGCHPGSRISGD